MLDINQIKLLVRQRDFSLSDAQANAISTRILANIHTFDFSSFNRKIYTQQGKKRSIFSYQKLSCEDILCLYLKKQIDLIFHIKYASRSQIMNMLFNILPVVKDMNDFVIVRADFKSFFDSVLIEHVYNNYIRNSLLTRSDKDILEQYVNSFKYCHAGLCLSNVMTEIICKDFDERIKAKLTQYGVFFYERYVDDIFIIMNKYISEDKFLKLMELTIQEVFGESPVRLATSQDKFKYIAKRNMPESFSQVIPFLGYEFELNNKSIGDKSEITFKYGITKKKRQKYSGVIEKIIIDYLKESEVELLRHRIKMYSSRVVIGKFNRSSKFNWITKGVVANYNELQYHIDALRDDTQKFLKDLYFDLMTKHEVAIPYFMKQSASEESIYNILSTMKRNRSIIFQDNIGVSRETLVKWIKQLDQKYKDMGNDYYSLVVEYLKKIKIQ